jgi:hypothetical protein
MFTLRFLKFFLIVFLPLPLYAQDNPSKNDTLSLENTRATLNQEFHVLPVWRPGAVEVDAEARPLNDPSFSWVAGYLWDHPVVGYISPSPQHENNYPAWTSNGAAEASPNGDMISLMAKNLAPFTLSNGLNFTVRKMSAALAETVGKSDPKAYIGATINSFPYSQLYGVFAMSAKLPRGRGLWPAFWLVPADKTWPPEIDIMEVIGREPSTLHTTVHYKDPQGHSEAGQATDTHLDLSAGFHEYTADWGPERIDWYFDRKLVFSQPTPPDLHKPCYIIANVAVGSSENWGGAPDSSTHFPATMQVAYIKAWQRSEYLAAKK